MDNVVEISYSQTGKSSQTDHLGMREMQAKVYKERHRRVLIFAEMVFLFCVRKMKSPEFYFPMTKNADKKASRWTIGLLFC